MITDGELDRLADWILRHFRRIELNVAAAELRRLERKLRREQKKAAA